MDRSKKQAAERNFEVLPFPEQEKAKLEISLDKSVSDLLEVICELREVERVTGRGAEFLDVGGRLQEPGLR